jgi:hypothetical protein
MRVLTNLEQVSKETYTSVKRDLHKLQKRPTQVPKETYRFMRVLTNLEQVAIWPLRKGSRQRFLHG